MTYASAQPLKDNKRATEKTLGEAVESLKAAVRQKTRAFYNRPIPANAKAMTARMMGEKPD